MVTGTIAAGNPLEIRNKDDQEQTRDPEISGDKKNEQELQSEQPVVIHSDQPEWGEMGIPVESRCAPCSSALAFRCLPCASFLGSRPDRCFDKGGSPAEVKSGLHWKALPRRKSPTYWATGTWLA